MMVRAQHISTQLLVFFLSAALAFEPVALALDNTQTQPLPADSSIQGRHAFTQQELDQMLAPIALYPDSLMSQILMASTYPLEVIQATRWSRANPNLNGEEAVRAVAEHDWDPSVKSLVAFPQILMMMDEKLDWTERLGGAFLSQQSQVMDTVQNLRQKAYAAGNLQSNDQVRVEPQGQTIIVEPARPQVVYVPYYDPWVVYGSWWWPAYPPVYWAPWPGYYARPGFGAGFAWGVGVTLGAGFFFGAFDWHHRHVNVINVNNYYYNRLRVNRAGVWEHNPVHRRGIPYRDEALRQRFGRASVAPESRRDFRGFDRREFEGRRDFGNRPDMRGGPGNRPEERTSPGTPSVRPETELRGGPASGREERNNAGALGAQPNTDMRGGPGNRREERNSSGGPDNRPKTDLRGDPGNRQEEPNNSGGFRGRPEKEMRGDSGNRREERSGRGGGGNRPNIDGTLRPSIVPDSSRSDLRGSPSPPTGSSEGGRFERRPRVFEGVGRGADVRSSSERGRGGSAPQASGNFRGGDGKSQDRK